MSMWAYETPSGIHAQALIAELDGSDPELKDPLNRERFVDAVIADAKAEGCLFDDEEQLRKDAIEYLDSLLV